MSANWTHLIRFVAEEDGQAHLGQIDHATWPDVGISFEKGEKIQAKLIQGCVFDGVVTERLLTVKELLAPLTMDQVPIIRCMGLNYRDHAKEANMPIPDVPVLFIKPRTALNGPYPAKVNVPKIAQDGTSDYEAELSFVISKTGRDIPREKALDYVLGYTASNDISARAQQFNNSQWCFSKGLDGSCPIGPVLVSPSALGDPHSLGITATLNGEIVQSSNTREMIFDVASIVSFLSQGTTLERGTIIMTGTGPGIGAMRSPPLSLKDGDDVRVYVDGIGTLINRVWILNARPTSPVTHVESSLQRRGRRYRDRCQSKATDQQTRSNESASPTDQTGAERSIVVDVSQSERRQSFASSSSRRKSDAQDQNASHKASKLNIHDLSFILHPSHEVTTPDEEPPTAMSVESTDVDSHRLFQSACQGLELSRQSVEKMVRIYFDNMVAINLFHEPTFTQTLHSITSESHLVALLAAICAYSVRFVPFEADLELQQELSWGHTDQKTPTTFLNLSSQQIDKALNECIDDPPPLCVLQALIVTTHCQLTQGVRGRAWRALGTCVRLAYELNLHLLDSRYAVEQYDHNTHRWCEDEERRRAWWAIWEMDVFASTIRRTPTAISWSQMEVLLPAPDSNWYQETPIGSCFLEQEPGQRWRALQESGNVSPKAWFIVINSLMKDAQVISCPRGVPSVTRPGQNWQQPPKGEGRQSISYQAENSEESRQKLETLANSVYCLVRVLPENLRYRQQHLSFSPRLPGQVESSRQLHCSIYNIYVMTQLARLMIHRYDVFGSQSKPTQPPAMSASCKLGFTSFQEQENPALREYFESADNVLSIVNRSCEDHIRHINPFLPSTIWLAAAVQMVRKQFGGPSTYNSLIKARFDVLYLTYKQCVSFWGIQTAMQQNLETIEAQLEDFNGKPGRSFPGTTTQPAWSGVSNSAQRWIPPSLDISGGHKLNCNPPSSQNATHQVQTHEIQKPLPTGDMDSLNNKGAQNSDALPKTPPESDHGEQITRNTMQGTDMTPKAMGITQSMDPLNTTFCADTDGPMASMPMLDFMLMPPQAGTEMHEMGDSNMMDVWKDMELPSDIRDLLSGFSTY
ncbi:hypothetical protein FANTH_1370 [Fusarium anthophilum]|uniref:Xylanolytic transcriptional activator regulatory domain-containing protein n=1 Tax=Fusarium anthophilum TaxID=48485 RepID=A0A8H4ZVV9_9HYPO|nr:hypothetical protein FANTH_1370 [Fusarium anthophilum]